MPHPNRRLGRQPRAHANLPHFSQLRRAARRQDIPSAKTWLTGLPQDLGMMLNDQLGCCTISALHHARQVWSFNAGPHLITDPDKDVLADYEALCGYIPGHPETDQGAVLQTVLLGAATRGLTTETGQDKPLDFFEIDPRLPQDIREVIALGGLVYLGIDVLDSWTMADAGGVWDCDSSPVAGGHAVIAAGYDADGYDIISWGMRFRMTPRAFAGYVSEAYWVADQNWIAATGLTPGGITQDELATAMATVREAA